MIVVAGERSFFSSGSGMFVQAACIGVTQETSLKCMTFAFDRLQYVAYSK